MAMRLSFLTYNCLKHADPFHNKGKRKAAFGTRNNFDES